jgi:dihydroneopterin aldolase
MSDRIILANLQLEGRHGFYDWEREQPQPFEVDVELEMDLAPAGRSDDLTRTVDYGKVDATVRRIVEGESVRLLETLAESIARDILADFPVDAVTVRVRKPAVQLGGPLDHAAVEITRRRPAD